MPDRCGDCGGAYNPASKLYAHTTDTCRYFGMRCECGATWSWTRRTFQHSPTCRHAGGRCNSHPTEDEWTCPACIEISETQHDGKVIW